MYLIKTYKASKDVYKYPNLELDIHEQY